MTQPEAVAPDQWIEWSGGPNPVPGATVEVRFGDGGVQRPCRSERVVWKWVHKGEGGDVHAYRVRLPQPPASVSPGTDGSAATGSEPKDHHPGRGEGELLPCPFCGGRGLQSDDTRLRWVECETEDCASTGTFTAWNRRAPTSYGKGEREAVARIIDPAAFMFSADELGDKVYSASRAHAFDRADRILAALQSGKDKPND